jgi:hypothetical protein
MNHHSVTYRRFDLASNTPTRHIGVRPQKGRPVKYLVVILAIALGVAAIVYGGFDDSPGGQLLGVLFIVGAVVLGLRMARRSR